MRTEGERRQLTVLFCDMVRFTELASRLDAEGLQDIVRRYEDTCAACVTRYETMNLASRLQAISAWVVPTNEELMIAQHTRDVLGLAV